MLPQFPEFKKIELSDQSEINRFTSRYEPYCDFNFQVLWSWDSNDLARVSLLNDNLIIELQDFREEGTTYSFLGSNKLSQTLDELFEYIHTSAHGKVSVGIVPETSIADIDLRTYRIQIDFNTCDYIYDLVSLATYPGNTFYKKRKRLAAFLKRGVGTYTEVLNIDDPAIQAEILTLTKTWADNKTVPDDDIALFLSKEYKAIGRFMKAGFANTLCLGVRAEQGHLIGFNSMIMLPHRYAIGLFVKYDKTYEGINEYLMSKGAEVLLQKGCRLVNGQEDLGIPGLRSSKNSYNPVLMLRKYTVTKK